MAGVIEYADVAGYLKNIFHLLNEKYFEGELPDVTISIQEKAGTYGHFSLNRVWMSKDGELEQHEINIAANGLNRNIENIVATLLHEMVHLFCYENGIQDTSNRGVYHNQNFKKEAELRGLVICKHHKYGWTITEPSQDLLIWIKSIGLEEIPLYRWDGQTMGNGTGANGGIGGGMTGKKKSSTRKYQCPCCKNSVRATKNLNIICGDCRCSYELVE